MKNQYLRQSEAYQIQEDAPKSCMASSNISLIRKGSVGAVLNTKRDFDLPLVFLLLV